MDEFENEFDMRDQFKLMGDVSGDMHFALRKAIWGELKRFHLHNVFWLCYAMYGVRLAKKVGVDIEQMFTDGKIVKITNFDN